MSFGEEVKRLRQSKPMSQQALADAAGVHQTFIANLEIGKRERLGADVLFKLSSALGVSSEHFRQFLVPDVAADPAPDAGDGPDRAAGKRK